MSAQFDGLLRVVDDVRRYMAQDVRLAALVAQLPDSVGDGDALRLLFRQLFRGRQGPTLLAEDGQPLLSRRELEVLREATCDLRHEEIAQRLGISTRTVGTHFENIYRKLGVRKPMQAVARAIALGYLDLDAISLVTGASRSSIREFSVIYRFLSSIAGFEGVANAATLKPLAEFGLLLMVVAGAASSLIDQERPATSPRANSVIYEIGAQGQVLRTFATQQPGTVQGLAIAPPHSARHGFAPGHLFALFDGLPQSNLNSSAVVEFTPEGTAVRQFRGGTDIAARLCGSTSLAFAPDGHLLVNSGALTEGILALSDGGAMVRRFADGWCSQVCVSRAGSVYGAQCSPVGAIVKVFDTWGRLVGCVGGETAGVSYSGVAVNSLGRVYVTRAEHDRSLLEEFDSDGVPLGRREVPGLDRGLLAISEQDVLYVPCQRSSDVKAYSAQGRLVRRVDLHGRMQPTAVAIGDSGRVWVSGTIG